MKHRIDYLKEEWLYLTQCLPKLILNRTTGNYKKWKKIRWYLHKRKPFKILIRSYLKSITRSARSRQLSAKKPSLKPICLMNSARPWSNKNLSCKTLYLTRSKSIWITHLKKVIKCSPVALTLTFKSKNQRRHNSSNLKKSRSMD